MILGVAIDGQKGPPLSGAYFAHLARTAESAGIDFVSLGYGPRDEAALDALSLGAAPISQTRMIGLCAVSALTNWAPFNVARAFAAFDHLVVDPRPPVQAYFKP